MSDLVRLAGAVRRDRGVDAWFRQPGELRWLAGPWFDRMRRCGPDVRELLHDGYPIACVGEAAFAYVNAFKAHVIVGFFHGASLDDPEGLLQGEGKRLRHVKIRLERPVDEGGLRELITEAYRDIRWRLRYEE